jgi:hypothetical protein
MVSSMWGELVPGPVPGGSLLVGMIVSLGGSLASFLPDVRHTWAALARICGGGDVKDTAKSNDIPSGASTGMPMRLQPRKSPVR